MDSSRILNPESPALIDLRDVPCTPEEWLLDRGRVLAGEFNILAGTGGTGKTTTVAGWIAELARRRVRVIYMGERSLQAIRKRLVAAEADLEYVRTLDLRQFIDIRSSIAAIEDALAQGYEVLVLDPVSHVLPVGVDAHRDSSLRHAMRGLSDVISAGKLTVIGLHHLNKNEAAQPINRLIGSTFFRDYPANVLGVGVHPNDPARRAIVRLKSNADDGALDGALVYQRIVQSVQIDGQTFTVATSQYVDTDPQITADDVFAGSRHRSKPADTKSTTARTVLLDSPWVPATPDTAQDEDWFAKQLEQDGGIRLDPKNVGKLLSALYEDGINYLPAKSGPRGFKKRYWRQPTPMTDSLDDAASDDLDDELRGLLEDTDDPDGQRPS